MGEKPTPGVVQASEPDIESLELRRERYLERVLDQLGGLGREVGSLEPINSSAGVLAISALAREGHETVAGRSIGAEATRYAEALLEECARHWHLADCPRAQMSLQRALLLYPDVFNPVLRKNLRREASLGSQIPTDEEIADPWSVRDTESERAVRMARNVVGQVVAGTPDSETARDWLSFTEAFLLAHERDGWYQAESPGDLSASIEALLLLADHAPESRAGRPVRGLAIRQLHLLFAGWAQNQVRGYPAGAKSHAPVDIALSDTHTPWRAWAWLITGIGDPKDLAFRDWPDLAVTTRYRVPEAVARLLADRSSEPPYAIRERRRIVPAQQVPLDTALATWATPDYTLGCAQAVEGLELQISGGQRIAVTLYPEGDAFAPVYLWSRTGKPRAHAEEGTGDWTGDDLAVCDGNVALARLGVGHGGGHVYLAPGWDPPQIVGEGAGLAVTRYGDTWLALTSPGGWELAWAVERFPQLYTDRRSLAEARVLVARRQPAAVGLVAGRAQEETFEAFLERVEGLHVTEGKEEDEGWLRFSSLAFFPGRRATVGGKPLHPRNNPLLAGPFLASTAEGGWRFRYHDIRYDLAPVARHANPYPLPTSNGGP